MQIRWEDQALKDLRKLPRADAARIVQKAGALTSDRDAGVVKLASFSSRYRLRVGNYRVLFKIEGGIILIYRALHRSSAYKRRYGK